MDYEDEQYNKMKNFADMLDSTYGSEGWWITTDPDKQDSYKDVVCKEWTINFVKLES